MFRLLLSVYVMGFFISAVTYMQWFYVHSVCLHAFFLLYPNLYTLITISVFLKTHNCGSVTQCQCYAHISEPDAQISTQWRVHRHDAQFLTPWALSVRTGFDDLDMFARSQDSLKIKLHFHILNANCLSRAFAQVHVLGIIMS